MEKDSRELERVCSSQGRWPRASWNLAATVWRRLSEHNASALAAAVAFYSFLSIFPAITALVSLYGLIANPNDIRHELDTLRAILPPEAVSMLSVWLMNMIHKPRVHFGLGLAISVAISLWSARYGAATLITALDVAYSITEQRTFLHYNAVALLLTTLLILFFGLTTGLIAVLPVLLGYLPIPPSWQSTAMWVRWPILLAMIIMAVLLLYRLAPGRDGSRRKFGLAGALLATVGFSVSSYGFSFYISAFSAYDKTYGSLGAVAVFLTWLWIAGYSVLAGAELNAEIASRRCDVPAIRRSKEAA